MRAATAATAQRMTIIKAFMGWVLKVLYYVVQVGIYKCIIINDSSEISSNGNSRSQQIKSVPFGNFNMCNKFDFKMFKTQSA